jgi:hypothetical protein
MQGFLGGVARGPRRVFEDPKIAAVVSAGTVVLALLKALAKEERTLHPSFERIERNLLFL